MRISDWSSDVCSSDLCCHLPRRFRPAQGMPLPLALPPQKGCIPLFGGAGEEHGHQIRKMFERAHIILSGRLFFRSFRSEEHTSELQSLMRISYAVFCLKKKI